MPAVPATRRTPSSSTARSLPPNPTQPWAQAVAIRGDRIVGVGDTATIVAHGRAVDPHASTSAAAPSSRASTTRTRTSRIAPPVDRLSLPFDPTIDQIADALRAQIKTTPAGPADRGEFGDQAWEHPSFTRAWLDCDRAGSSGVAGGVHRPRHAAQQPGARALSASTNRLRRSGRRRVRPRRSAAGLNGRLEEYAESFASRQLRDQDRRRRSRAHLSAIRGEARAFGITSTQLLGDCAARRRCREGAGRSRHADALAVLPLSDRGRRRNASTASRRCRRSRRR